jgi:hypothetical protein
MTHRGDEPRPQSFYDAVQKTLQICLGVQRMRQLGIFHVPDGGDYGVLWPIAIAAIRVPRGDIRAWVLDLLSNWPREGMIVSLFCLNYLIVRIPLTLVSGLKQYGHASIKVSV